MDRREMERESDRKKERECKTEREKEREKRREIRIIVMEYMQASVSNKIHAVFIVHGFCI